MKIITVASLKGGVGKTTVSIFLAQALGNRGKRVLLIDLDPNNNATDFTLADSTIDVLERANSYHVLTRKRPLKDCIHSGLFLDVMPATLSLHKAEAELAANPGLTLRFKKELEGSNYEFIVIDTPPSIDPVFRTGLYSADLVLSPIAPSRWVFQSLDFLRDEIGLVKENTDRKPRLLALPSMVTVKESEAMAKALADRIPLTKSTIFKQASLKNAVESRKVLKPESKAGVLFDGLAKELGA